MPTKSRNKSPCTHDIPVQDKAKFLSQDSHDHRRDGVRGESHDHRYRRLSRCPETDEAVSRPPRAFIARVTSSRQAPKTKRCCDDWSKPANPATMDHESRMSWDLHGFQFWRFQFVGSVVLSSTVEYPPTPPVEGGARQRRQPRACWKRCGRSDSLKRC